MGYYDRKKLPKKIFKGGWRLISTMPVQTSSYGVRKQYMFKRKYGKYKTKGVTIQYYKR